MNGAASFLLLTDSGHGSHSVDPTALATRPWPTGSLGGGEREARSGLELLELLRLQAGHGRQPNKSVPGAKQHNTATIGPHGPLKAIVFRNALTPPHTDPYGRCLALE